MRPGTAVSRILLDLFAGGSPTNTIKPDTLRRARRRAVRMGLIHDSPRARLTAAGRWYCMALRMGVSVPELAALASVYAQTEAWEKEERLASSGAHAFAIRDAGAFSPGAYRAGTIRSIYNRLVMKKLIRSGGCGVVELPSRTRERLRPYHADLMRLLDAAKGGAGAF